MRVFCSQVANFSYWQWGGAHDIRCKTQKSHIALSKYIFWRLNIYIFMFSQWKVQQIISKAWNVLLKTPNTSDNIRMQIWYNERLSHCWYLALQDKVMIYCVVLTGWCGINIMQEILLFTLFMKIGRTLSLRHVMSVCHFRGHI